MTLRTKLAATALACLTALPAAAEGLTDMSDAERAAFRAEVRAYLLDNPEVLMEAIGVLEAREAEASARAETAVIAANAEAIFEDGHSWVGGNPEGDITLVEFMDYRCGYCRKAVPEVTDLIETDGNIRFIIKEFPILGEASVLASRFAVAAKMVHGDDVYKQVHDALMVMRGDPTEASLRKLADDLALDPEPVMAQMGSPEITAILEENRALAQALNISGTPSFVMEDRMLRGYVPLDAMRQVAAEIRAD